MFYVHHQKTMEYIGCDPYVSRCTIFRDSGQWCIMHPCIFEVVHIIPPIYGLSVMYIVQLAGH